MTEDSWSDAPPEGTLIGPYRVVRPLARGGMALVLEAEDTRSGRRVALKVLRRHLSNEETRARFRREYRSLVRLQHPNILRVLEGGLVGELPWYSMELLDGTDLDEEAERLAGLPSPERWVRAIDLLRQAARALSYIHEHGLVHRDLSPGNLRILPDGLLKLMDFGVAKDLAADRTLHHEVVGTAAFMAPEQISGGVVDARADLYALGACTYLLLTNKRVFQAHTLHGYLEKHLHSRPRPPQELEPSLPRQLNDVVLRLLEKRPADRFASAAHLLEALGESPEEEAPDLQQFPPRTIGRAALKARLRDALDAVAAGRPGGALLITAATGHGKTRLLEMVRAQAARRGLLVAEARSISGEQPFGLMEPLLESLDPDGQQTLLRGLFQEDTTVPELYPLAAALRDLVVARAPCVLLLDDLEHADSATIDLLAFVLRSQLAIAPAPVLIVMGLDAEDTRTRTRLVGVEGLATVDLGPLEPAEVEELVFSLVGPGSASAALASRLHQETSGNPAFLSDMLQALVGDGLLVRQGARFQLQVNEAEITRSKLPMPESLRAALHDRLEPIAPGARALGQVLASARRAVPLEVLARTVGQTEEASLAHLEDLARAQIATIRQEGAQEVVELAHARFRDVLLEALSSETQQQLHRRLGEGLETYFRGRTHQAVEELAWHFERAGIPTKAYLYLVQCGTAQVNRSSYPEALALLDRARSLERAARGWMLLEDADRQLAELLLSSGRALFHLGHIDEAVGRLREADQVARALTDARLQARVKGELGSCLRQLGSSQVEAEQALHAAVELAEAAGDQTLIPQPLYELGGLLWNRRDLDGAEQAWKRCLQIAIRLGNDRATGQGYNGLAILAICRGQWMEARRALDQAIEVFERVGMMDRLAVTRVNLTEVFLNTGLFHKALTLAERTVQQSREVQLPAGVLLAQIALAGVRLALGQPELANEAAREAIDTARRLDSRDDEVTGLTTLVAIEAERGAWSEAESAFGELLPLLDRHDAEGVAPLVHALRARVAAVRGDLAGAEAALAQVGPLEALWAHTRLRTEIALGRALAALGRQDEARGHLQRALSSAEANGARYYQLMAHHWLADLLASSPNEEVQLARHRRIAQAVARSLSANLEPAEASSFLALRWGEPASGATS